MTKQRTAIITTGQRPKRARKDYEGPLPNHSSPVPGFLVSGCAAVPREAGFDDVQTLVSARSDSRILWNHGTREDPEVSRSVDALLTGELSAEAAVNLALQAEYEDVGVSQADLVQAGLLRNPVLFSTVRFPDRPPSGLSRGGPGVPRPSPSARQKAPCRG